MFYGLSPVWVGGGAAVRLPEAPRGRGVTGGASGSRGQCPWRAAQHSPASGSGPFCPTAHPAWPRVLLLMPARPHLCLPVLVRPARAHPPCLSCLVLLLLPALACPARTPWASNPQPLALVLFIAGRELMYICWGLYPLAGYIPFICTKEEESCFLWEMGEERRFNRTNRVSSPLSQTWKQLPRHPPSPIRMADGV